MSSRQPSGQRATRLVVALALLFLSPVVASPSIADAASFDLAPAAGPTGCSASSIAPGDGVSAQLWEEGSYSGSTYECDGLNRGCNKIA